MNAKDELYNTLDLLELEQQEDYALFKLRSAQKTISEKVAFGIAWFPVRITKEELGFGGKVHIEVERGSGNQPDHFQTGRSVTLFGAGSDRDTINGVITSLRRTRMRIALNKEELPEWTDESKLGVMLQFDESTYREMERSTRAVAQADNSRIAELREILLGYQPASFSALSDFKPDPALNESQNEAVQHVLAAKDVAIIHGPPGTGKTTTLVNAISRMVLTEKVVKQVLVCAPSNTAVDLLTEKLALKSLSVLRLGHPSRVSEMLLHHTLDGQLMEHKSYKELKELRKQSEEYRSMGEKYKRHFGWEEREQRRLLIAESKALKAQAIVLEEYITDQLIATTQVITCTLAGASSRLLGDKRFKAVFIDEAAQAIEPGCWIPIRRAEKVIFAGDHNQLPPTVKSLEADKKGLGISLMEKCIERQPAVAKMLRTQYRMNTQIMQFSNQQFYFNKLEAHESVANRVLAVRDDQQQYASPFEFIDTAGCGFDEITEQGSSTSNPEEAQLLIKHLKILLAAIQNFDDHNYRVGIISPYKSQVNILKELVEEDTELLKLKNTRALHIGTVDSFQGQERDIMYISMVRSNNLGEIGFLSDTRRMNVALTRAKLKLVVIGDSATLASHPFYQAFLDFAEQNTVYKSAWELITY